MPGYMPLEFCKLGKSFAALRLRANIDLHITQTQYECMRYARD
jgi:hypothetical protein